MASRTRHPEIHAVYGGPVFRFLTRYRILVPLALFLGFSPFVPRPHLVEKMELLLAGNLRRPLDLFDFAWHLWPLLLLGFVAGRDLGRAVAHQPKSRS